MHQKTLRAPCTINGIGLHSGKEVRLKLLPAPVNRGIVFRTRKFHRWIEIPAKAPFVKRTILSTTLGNADLEICTIEHLMSALAGMEVDNVIIEVSGQEVPVMDGSALPFVERIQAAGVKVLPAPRSQLRVLAPIVVSEGDRSAGLYPASLSVFTSTIDYPHSAIGTQSLSIEMTPRTFIKELAPARTFGYMNDLEQLQAKGLALGASLDNAIALGPGSSVINPEGLRFADEFVRHKLLDAVGDMNLLGMPMLAEYRGEKSGHSLHLKLLQAVAAQPERWEVVCMTELDEAAAV